MKTMHFLLLVLASSMFMSCNVPQPAPEEEQDPEGTVYYQVDSVTAITNPERGFYRYTDIHLKGDGTGGLKNVQTLKETCDMTHISLVFRYFYLDCYNDGSPISEADLQLINNDLAALRSCGLKGIIRFSYGANGYVNDNNWSFTEPTKEQMLAHMKQLKPVLAANADVVAAVQAGFVGIWGEWYFSSTFGKDWSKPNAVLDRNDLINGLLDMVPADRCVQVRTVHYITEYMGKGTRDYDNVLTDETAFSGSLQSRIGLHNDAFCHDQSNCGTYYEYAQERKYLANLGQYVPMGGETNGGSVNYYKGEKAMADMKLLHFDYINSNYETNVLNNWRQNKPDGYKLSYYDIIANRMGYRLALQSFYAPQVVQDGNLPITFSIYNDGFSNIYNRRVAYVVLKNGDKKYALPIQSDPRLWKSGSVMRVKETLSIPSDAKGMFHLYFAMPDVYATIADNEAYAIRLANKDMNWTEGLNDLGIDIEVQ